jgi:hypothetical protein
LLLFARAGSAAAQTAPLLDLSSAADVAAGDPLHIDIASPISPDTRTVLVARWGSYPSLAWNELALQGIEKYRLNPLRAARLLAHLHAALHDAWLQCAQAQLGPRCVRVAQHAAAGRVMQHFLPEEAPGRFMSLAISALASMQLRPADNQDRRALAHGNTAAWAAISRALTDGADRPLLAPRRPPPQPGTWRPTPPLFAINPSEQGAPRWRTWLLKSGDEVLPPPPLAYGSPQYVAEVREVLEVNRSLTEAQKKIADDWNLDVGTATPPGVWNRHAMKLIRERGLGMESATQVLAETNLAMFDALVACWNAKMKWWTERPITEVRERFDPSFVPHVTTPPFPGYVSGHASASGAAAYVLGARIPEIRDEVLAMAKDAAMSRLYGGIHLRSDNDEGLKLGLEVGRRAIERLDAKTVRKDQPTNK